MATGRSVFHHDAIVGVEGDHATCPACKAGGPVMNDCYPAFEIGGKQVRVSTANALSTRSSLTRAQTFPSR
ncbi:hypothetical protein [Cupriavidus oxalaticus]|uniref:hypothetical protein n=1 Tax=Cupriavidus oxalaticus TaxID=96344 RepID=UPI003B8A9488